MRRCAGNRIGEGWRRWRSLCLTTLLQKSTGRKESVRVSEEKKGYDERWATSDETANSVRNRNRRNKLLRRADSIITNAFKMSGCNTFCAPPPRRGHQRRLDVAGSQRHRPTPQETWSGLREQGGPNGGNSMCHLQRCYSNLQVKGPLKNGVLLLVGHS